MLVAVRNLYGRLERARASRSQWSAFKEIIEEPIHLPAQ
jgi:hypothetical protein